MTPHLRAIREELTRTALDGYVTAGHLALPADLHSTAVTAVRHLLMTPAELTHHTKHVTEARLRAGVHKSLLGVSAKIDVPVEMVLTTGPAILTGEQLAVVLTCPTTLATLGELYDEHAANGSLTAYWSTDPIDSRPASIGSREISPPRNFGGLLRAAVMLRNSTDQHEAPPLDAAALELVRLHTWDLLPLDVATAVEENIMKYESWGKAAIEAGLRRVRIERQS